MYMVSFVGLASTVVILSVFFFFQAEDGIRDKLVTGVQTCALPISAAVAAPAAGSETVLLAEDEELVRVVARKVLEQAGYRVLVAAGGGGAPPPPGGPHRAVHLLLPPQTGEDTAELPSPTFFLFPPF